MSVLVRNLTKRFMQTGLPALSNVSFDAPASAITALLGPSGAGKSTVLRLIAGLEEAEAGSITINGKDCSKIPIRKREVGFVFQSYALFDHMTVRENIGFGLSVRKTPRVEGEARVQELLRLIQLEDFGDRRPTQLSGGQRQRVAFARALAVRPKVLLLDEPFGALDARVRVDLREWLRRLHSETHITTLLVTHDQDEAFEIAEHVVIMFDGRIAQSGPSHEVYDHPANAEVALFTGSANVFGGRVQARMAHFGPLAVPAPATAREGERVQILVRPHDVRLARPPAGGPALPSGRITGIRRVGGYVKLTVVLPGGETVNVQSPKSEIDSLRIAEGDRVLVDIRAAKVFAGDGSR